MPFFRLRLRGPGTDDALQVAEGASPRGSTSNESRSSLSAIFQQTTAGLAKTDPSGRILVANEPFCRIVGRSPSRLRKLRWQDLIDLDDLTAASSRFEESVTGGGDFAMEIRYARPWGPPVWVRTSGSAARDSRGRARSVLITLCDVTEHKRVERALLEADRRKNEFLATLAHELRNPVCAMRNSLEILQFAAKSPETVQRATAIMERQCSQMMRLIDDIRDVTLISRGKLQLQREEASLGAILRGAVEEVRLQIDRAGHELKLILPPDSVHLHADPGRLIQVFTNILANACKFTEAGGRITVAAEWHGGEVVVQVTDTGIGIPADQLPHLFERYVQGDSPRSQGGLGIGLSLVRDLVRMHGGAVSAQSEGPGKGSTFIVRLPASGVPHSIPLVVAQDRDEALYPSSELTLHGAF